MAVGHLQSRQLRVSGVAQLERRPICKRLRDDHTSHKACYPRRLQRDGANWAVCGLKPAFPRIDCLGTSIRLNSQRTAYQMPPPAARVSMSMRDRANRERDLVNPQQPFRRWATDLCAIDHFIRAGSRDCEMQVASLNTNTGRARRQRRVLHSQITPRRMQRSAFNRLAPNAQKHLSPQNPT